MPRLLLLLALGLLAWYLWQKAIGLKDKPPKERRAALLRATFIGLFVVTLILVATGRAHWIAAAIAGLLPLAKILIGALPRALPFLHWWQRNRGGFRPTLRSAFLEVKVNISNGQMDGTVLQGEHVGEALSALSQQQLNELLTTYRNCDRESAMLLNAYIRRRFADSSGFAGGEHEQNYQPGDAQVAAEEAWQILGLEPGASKEDILKAHKRLIQKVHPDRGGNDYLAAKINAAKDHLVSIS